MDPLTKLLKTKKITLALAESISGGFVSYTMTKTPGSSSFFKGSLVVYSMESKVKFFKIPMSTLVKTQGVSSNVALILAKKVKKLFFADIGASIVGFAGPKAIKGVKAGTVYLGVSYKNQSLTKKAYIKGDRDTVRKKSSKLLLDLIYQTIATNS